MAQWILPGFGQFCESSDGEYVLPEFGQIQDEAEAAAAADKATGSIRLGHEMTLGLFG